jgi:lactase-phlorizin hydrolase
VFFFFDVLKVAEKSSAQGFETSRLPAFTQEEMDNIAGSADFLGINHYSAYLVENSVSDINDVSYFADHDTRNSFDPSWYE